jgi:gluconolactonase
MAVIHVLDPRFDRIVGAHSRLERLCTGAIWSEGPVWLNKTHELVWSDIPNNRMLAWHPTRGQRVWRDKVEYTNGHALEADGALLHCSHGLRAIVRTRFDASGMPLSDELVVSHHQGKRLNSPNDIVVKRDGSLWFSDPPYGIVSDREGHQAASELGANHVFRFDPRTGDLRIVSSFLEEPNGLAFSPDERVLYVSDTSAALRQDGSGHHHIVAFDVVEGETLTRPRIFAVIEPGLADGLRVDENGFVYTSSADSVQVFDADGVRIGRIEVPEKVGNLCFGGAHGNELFICASTSLYRVTLNTQGATAQALSHHA